MTTPGIALEEKWVGSGQKNHLRLWGGRVDERQALDWGGEGREGQKRRESDQRALDCLLGCGPGWPGGQLDFLFI